MSDAAALSRVPESRTAPIFDRAPLPMVEVEGTKHHVCFVNSAFCALVQRTRSELMGKTFAEIVSNGTECIPLLDRIYETGAYETHVISDASGAEQAHWLYAMWPTLDQHARPMRVVIQLTKSADFRLNTVHVNEALMIAGLHQHELRERAEAANTVLQSEIEERRRVEAALHEAEARLQSYADDLERTVQERTTELHASLGELEAFSYSLLHDLAAPVRAIRGFTELVLQMPPEEVGAAAQKLLKRVTAAATRMDSLIQDVLSLSHVVRQPVTLTAIDVDALVQAVVEERRELSPPGTTIEIRAPLMKMFGHQASLNQCLTNLLDNAIKFVGPGEQPRITIRSEEIQSLRTDETRPVGDGMEMTSTSSRALVRLWIEDRGIGIEPEALESVFRMFHQLNSSSSYPGSGMGLAIVRKAIERMGGRVGVESQIGQGSRFWLELPKA